MQQQHKRKRIVGFTLTELVIVIVIIAVLALVIFVGGGKVIADSRVATATSDLYDYIAGSTLFMQDNYQLTAMDASSGADAYAAIAEIVSHGTSKNLSHTREWVASATSTLIGDFILNADVNRRDQLLFGESYVPSAYVSGRREFSSLTADAIEELIEYTFIDQYYRRDNTTLSPSAQMFLDFMKGHKQFTAFGYAVLPDSDDYNVVIQGIEAEDECISKKTQDEFQTEFAKADELVVKSTHCRCYYS